MYTILTIQKIVIFGVSQKLGTSIKQISVINNNFSIISWLQKII